MSLRTDRSAQRAIDLTETAPLETKGSLEVDLNEETQPTPSPSPKPAKRDEFGFLVGSRRLFRFYRDSQ